MRKIVNIFIFLREMIVSLALLNRSPLGTALRSKIYRTACRIDTSVIITNPARFDSGLESALYHGSYILNNHGSFHLGRRSHLGAYCYVNVNFGEIRIGDDVAIGPGTKIIAYSNHYASGSKVTDEKTVGDINIGNNVFIGANCTILPGTIVGENVVIAAGAVVKGKLEENAIYGGVPVKCIATGWYA